MTGPGYRGQFRSPAASASMGYRFPTTQATPKQLRALADIATAYQRRLCVYALDRGDPPPVEVFARTFGLSESHAKTFVGAIRRRIAAGGSPKGDLVLDVLLAMHTGRVAGVMGTPRTATTKWLFATVNYVELRIDHPPPVLTSGMEDYVQSWEFLRTLKGAFMCEYGDWRRE
jgi:hypothetical protein